MEKVKSLNWLVRSSQNPQEVSMTLKGILIVIVPLFVQFSGILHVAVDQEGATQLVDGIAMLTQAVLTLVGSIVFVIGLVRKFVK